MHAPRRILATSRTNLRGIVSVAHSIHQHSPKNAVLIISPIHSGRVGSGGRPPGVAGVVTAMVLLPPKPDRLSVPVFEGEAIVFVRTIVPLLRRAGGGVGGVDCEYIASIGHPRASMVRSS
jgi:hypothetical protein